MCFNQKSLTSLRVISHCVKNLLWKRLRTHCKTDKRMDELINPIQSESFRLHFQYYEEAHFSCSTVHHKNKSSSMRYVVLQEKQMENRCIPLWSASSTHVWNRYLKWKCVSVQGYNMNWHKLCVIFLYENTKCNLTIILNYSNRKL